MRSRPLGTRCAPVLFGVLLGLALPGCNNKGEQPAEATTPAPAAPAPTVTGEGILILRCSATPEEGTAPVSVRLNPDVIPRGETGLTYLWNFGDGGTSGQAQPQHVYSVPGTYQVRLTASRGGTTATCATTVYVYGPLAATCRSRLLGGTSVHFHVLPSFCVNNLCGYSWDFGGAGAGTDVNGPRPDFTYAAGGTYTATATVTTARQTASCRETVTVP